MDRSGEPVARERSTVNAPGCGDRVSFLDEWVPRGANRRGWGGAYATSAPAGRMSRSQRRAWRRRQQRLARVRGLMACMCGVCVSVSGLLLGQSATYAMMTAQAPPATQTFTADGHGVLINVLTTNVSYTVVDKAVYNESIPFTRPTPNSLVVGTLESGLPQWVGVGTTNVTDTGGDVGLVIDAPQSAVGKSFSGTVTVYVGPGKFDFYTIDVTINVIDPCDDNGQGDDKGDQSDKDHGQGSCHTSHPKDDSLGMKLAQNFGDSLSKINGSDNSGGDTRNTSQTGKDGSGKNDPSGHKNGSQGGDSSGSTVTGQVYKDRQDPPPTGDGQGAIPKTIDLGSGEHSKSGSTVTGDVDKQKGSSGSEDHGAKGTGGASQ